jgi:hypothetical protein
MLRLMVRGQVYLGVKPHLGPKTRFLLLSAAGFLIWGTLSDKRMGLSFAISIRPRQDSRSRVWVLRDSVHMLLSQVRDPTNLEGQVPVFIFPRNRVTQLYPQALCSKVWISSKYYIITIHFAPHRKHISTTKRSLLMLFRETVAVYCEDHVENTNTLHGQNAVFLLV